VRIILNCGAIPRGFRGNGDDDDGGCRSLFLHMFEEEGVFILF